MKKDIKVRLKPQALSYLYYIRIPLSSYYIPYAIEKPDLAKKNSLLLITDWSFCNRAANLTAGHGFYNGQ